MKNLNYLILLLFLFACQTAEQKPEPSTTTETPPLEKAADTKQQNPTATSSTEAEQRAKKMVSDANLQANKFKSILIQMGSINYQLKNFKELPPEQTNMNGYIRLANKGGKYNAALIDMSGVRIIRRAFIKGIKPTKPGGDTYNRADIEAWECTDEQTAKGKIEAFDALKKEIPWDVVSKSPITYWRDGSQVLFIVPGGFYMLDEVPKIQKFLEEKM